MAKKLTTPLSVVMWILRAWDSISEDTGFGTLKLDIKDRSVVYVEKTVRDHLN